MMRLAAYLLISAALVAGVLGASTAYSVPLSLSDESLVGLTLGAPAGDELGVEGAPLVASNTELTAPLLERLRAADVGRVIVKEFSLARWREKWWFFAGVIGLVVGALLARSAQRAERAAAGLDRAEAAEPAAEALRELHQTATKLSAGDASLEALRDELGEALRVHATAFVDARPVLLPQLGLASFAQLMDRFAAAERALNRAWSAAADRNQPEAAFSLRRGVELLGETIRLLGEKQGAVASATA